MSRNSLFAGLALCVVVSLCVGAILFDVRYVYAGGPGHGHLGRGGTSGPTPTPTPYSCPGSKPIAYVYSPDPGSSTNSITFNAVAAVAANDVWAVGGNNDFSPSGGQTLIEHFDGTAWSIVPSQSPANPSTLYGIAAVSSNDVWAVGAAGSGPLAEHWNGSTWSTFATPAPSGGLTYALYAVAALASDDVWAVGGNMYSMNNTSYLLVEHWDGAQWSLVQASLSTGGGNLFGIVALADNNIWAVGSQGSIFTSGPSGPSVIVHYDGNQWSVISNPSPGAVSNYLTGVAAISPTDIWAAGYYSNFDGQPYSNLTLVEHWNGTSWSVVPTPNPAQYNDMLRGITVDAAQGVWVTGSDAESSIPQRALVEHWTNGAWQLVATPDTPENAYIAQLNAAAAAPGGMIWFVGYQVYSNQISKTLVEQYPRKLLGVPCPLGQ